jgi:hypothetical protein
MSKIEIILFACVAVILFTTLTYLLIAILSKISRSSKAKFAKTMDDFEQNRPFKL